MINELQACGKLLFSVAVHTCRLITASVLQWRGQRMQQYLLIVFDLVFSAAAVRIHGGFPPNQSHTALLNLLRSQLVNLGRR